MNGRQFEKQFGTQSRALTGFVFKKILDWIWK